MLEKILKFLWVIQIVNNLERQKRGLKLLGCKAKFAIRINPYNPLSYFVFLIETIRCLFLYGFINTWEDMKRLKIFKWY